MRRAFSKLVLTPLRIADMQRSADPLLHELGEALAAHRSADLSDEEERHIREIEASRARLCQSRETISVPDYGAGAPEDLIPASEMLRGRMTTEIVGEACQQYSKPPIWAALLFQIIRKTKRQNCLELGTCLGISAAYEALALKLNGSGGLVTLEGAAEFAKVAECNLMELGLDANVEIKIGRFIDTLPDVLSGGCRFDYVFIDGHHDEEATVDYFERIVPHFAEPAVVIFDDIDWSQGMVRAWKRIKTHRTVGVAIDLVKIGICLTGTNTHRKYGLVIE